MGAGTLDFFQVGGKCFSSEKMNAKILYYKIFEKVIIRSKNEKYLITILVKYKRG